MPAARSRSRTEGASVKPDAYVGLLILSLVALITAMVFAYLNWDQIKEKPKAVQVSPPGGGARMPAAPVAPSGAPAPGAGAPGMVPPGGAPANVPPGANPPQAVPPQNK